MSIKHSLVAATFLGLFISNIALAKDVQMQKNRNNEIDGTYQSEAGWAMYYDDVDKNVSTQRQQQDSEHGQQDRAITTKAKNSTEAILLELLKESKKQTRLQTEIRDILKKEFAPEPVLITKEDGTKCIENSSADCFVMPMIAEARRIPVLAAWMQNPTEDNAKNYMQWQSKLFDRAFDMGNSMQFALTKFGTEAYPQSFQRSTFDSAGNIMSVIKDKRQEKIIRRLTNSIEYEIYLGMNLDADIYALDNIAKIITTIPESKFTLVFKDEKSRKAINVVAKTFLAFSAAIANGNIKTKVDTKAFDDQGMHTTPTFVINYKGNKDIQPFKMPIADGRLSANEFLSKVMQALEYKKVISRAEMADYKSWKDGGNYSSDYLEHFYGLKLDKDKLREIYQDNGN